MFLTRFGIKGDWSQDTRKPLIPKLVENAGTIWKWWPFYGAFFGNFFKLCSFPFYWKEKNRNDTKYECLFGFHEKKALKCEGDYFELLLFLSSRYGGQHWVFSLLLFQGERGRPGPQGPKGEQGLKVSSPALLPYCSRTFFSWIMFCLQQWDVVFHSSHRSYSIRYRHHGGKGPLSSGWIGLRTRIKTLCDVSGQAKVCSHFPRRSFARGHAITWELL